jgi:hypothetical protein
MISDELSPEGGNPDGSADEFQSLLDKWGPKFTDLQKAAKAEGLRTVVCLLDDDALSDMEGFYTYRYGVGSVVAVGMLEAGIRQIVEDERRVKLEGS